MARLKFLAPAEAVNDAFVLSRLQGLVQMSAAAWLQLL